MDILQISIKDYLEGIGIPTRKEGSRYFASSPFSRDSNWSFVIYPTNTYFDFSTGHGGNIINLVSRLNGISLSDAANQLRNGVKHEKYKPNYKKIKEELFKEVEFKLEKYINHNEEECEKIHAYAKNRGITEGYFCGVFFTRFVESDPKMDRPILSGSKWIRVPALGFLHVDKNLKPCGAKFRKIITGTPKDQSPRFSARGNLGFYMFFTQTKEVFGTETHQMMSISEKIAQLNTQSCVLYVVESESSANSLASWLQKHQISSVVLSRGGVSSACKTEDLPEQLQGLQKKLIIDYDGNEELYQQRLQLYSDLDAQPIKLILPKGEDINSLYVKNEMWKIENLLL